MIHVCFALADKTGRYAKFTGTTMCSIFENSASSSLSITIHILHDNTLTPDNRDKFVYLAGQYHQLVKFYNVEELCTEEIADIRKVLHEAFKERFSVAAMNRFLIPTLLSSETDKAIYLDSDIIVNLDINKLWQIELYDKPLGAIPNVFQSSNKQAIIEKTKRNIPICGDNVVNVEDYFNSGVLLMNLNAFRDEQDNIMAGIKFIGEHPEYNCFDQDVLNYCFSKTYLRLPAEFNQYVKQARPDRQLTIERKIYHYAGAQDGLGLNMDDPFNKLWMEYFTKTPWFDINTIYNLYKGVDEFGETRRNMLIEISAAMSGKKRVFVVDEKVDWLKKVYFIRNEEEIFICKDKQTLPKLIEEMKASRDTKIFFVRDWNLIKLLKQAGFVEGKDFFNHYTLFSSKLFEQNDSYSLILAM